MKKTLLPALVAGFLTCSFAASNVIAAPITLADPQQPYIIAEYYDYETGELLYTEQTTEEALFEKVEMGLVDALVMYTEVDPTGQTSSSSVKVLDPRLATVKPA